MTTLAIELDTKRCSRCGETKPLDEFSNEYARKDGKQRYCKLCAYARVRENQQMKRDIVRGLKGDTCSACGRTFESTELHFHHVDPQTKLFSISQTDNHGLQAILAEIEKCIVVCYICHAKIHGKPVVKPVETWKTNPELQRCTMTSSTGKTRCTGTALEGTELCIEHGWYEDWGNGKIVYLRAGRK